MKDTQCNDYYHTICQCSDSYALRASDADNDAAALFSGNSSTDCSQRRSDMSWDNFDSFPRRPNRKRSCSDELAHGWSDARSCAVCSSIGLSMRALEPILHASDGADRHEPAQGRGETRPVGQRRVRRSIMTRASASARAPTCEYQCQR
jgi:hypothetical protein